MAYLSPETRLVMLGIIREARNDLKKRREEYEAKVRSIKDLKSVSMISCAPSMQEELNLKKKAENLLGLEGDQSVLLKLPNACEGVDGRNHQILARKASGGREMSRNFESPLGNFVEHMVGQKQQEVYVVENKKMECYHDGFGLQASLSASTVTFPLPKKPPDPPDMIHGKSRNKEFDTPGHCQLKHKGLQIVVVECDDEEKVEELVDGVSVVFYQKEKQATDQEYEHAKAKLSDYCSQPSEYLDDSALLIKSPSDIELLVAHEFSDSYRSVLSQPELALCISGVDVNEEKHCICLSQVERVWEPGGLPTEAAKWYWPEKRQSLWFSTATTSEKMAERIWEPGGLSANAVQCYWREKHYSRGYMLQVTSKLHRTEVQVLSCLQEIGVRSKLYNVLKLFVGMNFHKMKREAAVEIYLWTLQKKEKFLASRWLIFDERVASPSYIPGHGYIKVTHGNGDALMLLYLVKNYGDGRERDKPFEMIDVTNQHLVRLILILSLPMLCWLILIIYRILRSSYGTQQKIQTDGFISSKSPFCRFLVICLHDNALQILSSSGDLLLRHKDVFQPLASTTALPHYLMEISNDKRFEIESTLDKKKVQCYNNVVSNKEVPPVQVPIFVVIVLFESSTSVPREVHAVKVFIFGDKDGLKKGVL